MIFYQETMENLSLKIPNPCSQNPRNFTPTGKGGFCQSCQKEVVDFRKMSQKEVVDFLNNNSSSRCGIFVPSQLEFKEISKKRVQKSWIWGLGIIGILGLALPGYSKTAPASSTERSDTLKTSKTLKPKSNFSRIVKGTVRDLENQMEVSGTTILIKGYKIGTAADVNGNFEIIIPDSIQDKKIVLVFSFIGYNMKEISFHQNQLPLTIGEVFLEQDNSAILGEYVYISQKRNFWQKLKGIFQKDDKANCSIPSHLHS